jgi:hypothetical protein
MRSSVRFPLRIPISFTADAMEQQAETCDISSGGVLFNADTGVEVGTRIDFSFAMPAKVMGWRKDVRVQCVGRVVRCIPSGERHAVAAVIDDYNFIR